MTYYPKKPIRSFQDLQVYQLSYNLMIKILQKLDTTNNINLQTCISKVPELIATAHSLRFGDSQKGIKILEETMLNCNLAVHYLSLTRDLERFGTFSRNSSSEPKDLDFESCIKQYLQIRTKILRLQMSWKKFSKEYDQK